MVDMGFNLEVLPPADRESVDIGLKYTNNEICYPAIVVIGDDRVLEQVRKQHIDHNGCKPGEDHLCIFCSCRTFSQVIQHFKDGFHHIPNAARHKVSLLALLQRAVGSKRNQTIIL